MEPLGCEFLFPRVPHLLCWRSPFLKFLWYEVTLLVQEGLVGLKLRVPHSHYKVLAVGRPQLTRAKSVPAWGGGGGKRPCSLHNIGLPWDTSVDLPSPCKMSGSRQPALAAAAMNEDEENSAIELSGCFLVEVLLDYWIRPFRCGPFYKLQ